MACVLRAQGLLPPMEGTRATGGAGAAVDPAVQAARDCEARKEARRRARQARWCWRGTRALAGTPAERYLRSRGITGPLPRTLRFHPACWHGPTARRRPALVALVEGAPSFAVHRTYLTREGRRITPAADAKLMLGATLGGAVRLREGRGGDAPLVVAEGIETALSLLTAPGLVLPSSSPPPSVWAALSASNLAGLALPPRPGRLVVAADGDPGGRRAAEALAARARDAGWDVAIRAAPEGRDWNDVARERATA